MKASFEETATVSIDGSHERILRVHAQKRVGPYWIVEEIASGGMGSVYVAVRELERGVRKVVALKVIHPHLAKQPGFVQMFFDEAALASRIAHPNAATIVDFGEADGTFFLAMEYLHGESLNVVLKALRDRPELRRTVEHGHRIAHIIAEVAEGIHALHELRDEDGQPLEAVHRDVSPHNILIGYDGRVTVLDFGVARSKDKEYQTETGEIRGKLAYVSPEQLRGQTADRRSDLWSLGIVLWESLTLRALFARSAPVETLLAVSSAPIDLVSEHYPLVGPELETLCAKALQRNPADRPQRADTFAMSLRALNAAVDRRDIANLMDTLFPQGSEVHRARRTRARTSTLEPVVPKREAATKLPWPKASVRAVTAGVMIAICLTLGLLFWQTKSPEQDAETQRNAETQQNAEPHAKTTEPTAGAGNALEIQPLTVIDAAVIKLSDANANPQPEDNETSPTNTRTQSGSSTSTQRRQKKARGTLNLVTPGGWAIVLDDKGTRLGRTPLSIELPAGTRHLTLVPLGDGSRRQSITVQVRKNQISRKSVPLR